MKVAVLARTHWEFDNYCRELLEQDLSVPFTRWGNRTRWIIGDATYIYGNPFDRIRGMRIDKFVRTGNWYQLPMEQIDGFAMLEKVNQNR